MKHILFEREIPEIEENPIDDTEHFQTVRMKDKNGKMVADCTIEIDDDGTILPFISKWDKTHKHTASNLFAGLVTKYFPNKKIRWKATSEASVKSYNKFCKDFPKLAEKVDFVDVSKNYQPVIDKDIPSLYASEKGVNSNGKGSNHSQEQGRSGQSLEREVGSDSGSPSAQNLMQGERTSGGTLDNGTVGKGLSTSDERGKASNGSDSKRQITKNLRLPQTKEVFCVRNACFICLNCVFLYFCQYIFGKTRYPRIAFIYVLGDAFRLGRYF